MRGALPIVLACTAAFAADTEDDQRKEAVEKFAAVQAKNRASFHGYRWLQRDTVYLDREVRAVRTFRMLLDDKGELEAVLASHALRKSKKPKLRIAVTQKDRKREKEFVRWIETAEKTLRGYVYYPTAKMTAFLKKAKVEPGTGSMEGAVAASGANFLTPGDMVRVFVDPKSLKPLRIEYHARIGGDAVRGWVTYGTLEGTDRYYPARTELTAPGKKVRLVLVNNTFNAPAAAK